MTRRRSGARCWSRLSIVTGPRGKEIPMAEIIRSRPDYTSYNVPTPIPFCLKETAPGKSCGGYGPDLVPASA